MARGVESVYEHWAPLTQKQFNKLIFDFEAYCAEGSMVIDKNGHAVPMILNEAQVTVARFLLAEIFAEIPSPTNLFIHKSRQMGISVLFCKIEQFCGTRLKNLGMQHIMPIEEDADDLFEKKFIPLLQGLHPELSPENYKTERRLKFAAFGATKLGGYINYSSSQKKSAGRGGTNQVVIEDEQAFYERVNSLERGLLATMPKTGRALRVVVSTANGMNHFYDLSKIAQSSNLWKYLFLPWHMLAEYEMEPTGRLKLLTELTDYEVKLCAIFEKAGYPIYTWARKMQWYQYVFETEAKRDVDYMRENYPSTAEESFAATGDPVLPGDALISLRDAEVFSEFVELTTDERNRTTLKHVPVGTIRRFKNPIPRHKYQIWCDPADGGEEGDFSSAVVVDLDTMEDVLCVKEKLDQNDFAELAAHLGRMYNNAMIVPERNTGQSMIDWLVNVVRYFNVYVDPFASTSSRAVYGVYMSRPVKSEAIMRMKFLLNNKLYRDFDPEFLEEGLHFVWKKTPSGLQKAIATEGYHDDTVMARLIGVSTLNMKRWKEYNQNVPQTGSRQI